MIGLRLDRLDPRVVQVLNLAAVAGQRGHAAGARRRQRARGRRPARRHRRRRRRRAARRGRRRPARRAPRPDRPGDPGPPRPHPAPRSAPPGGRGHRAVERPPVVAGRARPPPVRGRLARRSRHPHRRRAARRPALGRRRRLRGRRDPGPIGSRASSPTRSAPASGPCWRCCAPTSSAARATGPRRSPPPATAAVWARRDGDPMLLANAAESWMMSLSGVGFDIGMPADRSPRRAARAGDRRAARPTCGATRCGCAACWRRCSCPIPTRPAACQLADEAMAIAEVGDESELVASALLARRLAWWQLDRLDERTDGRPRRRAPRPRRRQRPTRADGDAVRHERPARAGSDGRAPGDARRVHARAPTSCTCVLFQVYGHVPAGVARPVGRRLRRGPAPRRRRPRRRPPSHGVNAEVAYAGVWFRLALDLGTLPATLPRASGCTPPTRACGCGRSPSCAASSPPAASTTRGCTTRTSSALDGVQMRDNQMFLPATCTLAEVAVAIDDPERAAVVRRSLEPYADAHRHQRAGRDLDRTGQPLRRPGRRGGRRPRRRGRVPAVGHRPQPAATAPAPTRPGPTTRWAACCAPRATDGRTPRRRRRRRRRSPAEIGLVLERLISARGRAGGR